MSTDSRGRTSCCSATPHCQSNGRLPHPCMMSGFTRVVLNGLPKFRFCQGPHSPLSAGLLRSHCGILSPLSVHVRVVVVCSVTPGFAWMKLLSLFAGCRYLLKLTLIAVLP